MRSTHDLVRQLYAAYNRRDADALLALLTDDVDWPDGPAQPGRMHGKDALRAYWEHQWRRVHTHDEPGDPVDLGDGHIAVPVRQVVHTPDGTPFSTARFTHHFRIREGRAARLDIETGGTPA